MSNEEPKFTAEQIAAANDELRKNLLNPPANSRMVTTDTIAESEYRNDVLKAVMEFDSFCEDNDPYGEHDCFSFQVNNREYIAKIDYYLLKNGEPDFNWGGDVHNEPVFRILTIMMASEY